MSQFDQDFVIDIDREQFTLEDYQGSEPRWCPGCGDNSILTSVQRLCRDNQLPLEKTVFVSGIGCSSRFPHYMSTYGFHGLHGRALPIAEGIKMHRPDLNVFVNMGDGDCCSIGTAHWIHALRYNMNLVAIVHDNEIYGLTKMQVSPTSPLGLKTSTTPYGAYLKPLNMLSTTLGVTNVSFVANAVEWIPNLLHDIIKQAFEHKGFSFIRVVQRCPHYLPSLFDPYLTTPDNILVLTHEKGLQLNEAMSRVYKHREEHDPLNIDRAREIVGLEGKIPVGVLYRNDDIPCYDEIRRSNTVFSPEKIESELNEEFDKFAINPVQAEVAEGEK
jgi:2-oxoglutarate ferredoxin oxidoreductase subunit beta